MQVPVDSNAATADNLDRECDGKNVEGNCMMRDGNPD